MDLFNTNEGNQSESKQLLIIGHLGFLFYILMCVLFYKERLLNNDAGYYSFHVVNYEEYFVKHGRYISYFTQSLSLLIIKLGGSLKAALLAYSVSSALWFYGLFLLAVYWLRSTKGGLFILLSLILTMRYKFYAGHTEITFAIAVASFLIVWILTNKDHLKNWKPIHTYCGTFILSCWLLIIHPIIVVPLFMVLGFFFLFYELYKDKWYWGNLVTMAALFAIRYVFVAQDGYESEKMGLLSDLSVFTNPGDFYVYDIMVDYFESYIIISMLVFLISIIGLLLKKKILPSLYFLVCFVLLSIIIIMPHNYLRSNIYIMIDGYIAMYGMIIALALYYFYHQYLQIGKSFQYVILALVLISSIKIFKKHDFYENRLEQYKILLKEQSELGHSKIFLPYNMHDWDQFWFPYEVPLESLMISAMDDQTPEGTIFIDDQNRGFDKTAPGKNFIAFYSDLPLNPRYFSKDTSQYVLVKDVPWKRDN